MELPACPEVRACHSEGNPIGTVRRPEREKGRTAGSIGAGQRANTPGAAFSVSGTAERGTCRLDFQN